MLTVALFLTIATALGAQEPDLERSMTRGKLDFDLGSFEAAATTFEQIARDPSVTDELHWEALVRLGQARARLGDHAVSVRAFREVMTSHGDDPEAVRFLTLAVAGVAPGSTRWSAMWRDVALDVVEQPRLHAVMRWPGFSSDIAPSGRGGETVSLHVENAPLATAVRELGAGLGASWLIYPDAAGEVTASFVNEPASRALELVVSAAGADVLRDVEGVVVITDSSGTDRFRRARRVPFSGESITVDFDHADLLDLFRFLADVTGNNFVVLPGVSGRAELAMTDRPWDAVLFHAVTANGLAFSMVDNVVVVGAPEAMAPYVAMEGQRYHGERVSLGFSEVGLDEVRRFFEEASGRKVVAREPLPGSFTFKLTEVPWDHALDLVAALNDRRAEVDESTILLEPR